MSRNSGRVGAGLLALLALLLVAEAPSQIAFAAGAVAAQPSRTRLQANAGPRTPAVATTAGAASDDTDEAAVDEETAWKDEVLRLREESLVQCLLATEDDEGALEQCQSLSYELARAEARLNIRHGSDALKET
mmetsp:Transcript_10313/g.14582  ORF Transcript_10313/g.14582 Transcript_10313/m.14582 type:complete len:133 (-) Transcript_10313:124-522(-)